MSQIAIDLPPSLDEAVREFATNERLSVNEFVAQAVIEKLSALKSLAIIRQHTRPVSREEFLAALKQIPDTEPEAQDRWPTATSPPPTDPS